MTDTPIADRTEADLHPPAPPAQRPTRFSRISHDLTGIGHAILHMAPVMAQVAVNPGIDEAVELLLDAAGLGAEAHDLAPVLAVLRDLVARKAAQQPPFAPAAAAPHPEDPEG